MDLSSFALAGVRLPLRFTRIKPMVAAWRIDAPSDLDIVGHVWVSGGGRVHIGHGVRLIGRRAPIELRAHPGGEIVLGDGVLVEDGASIEATRSVTIGARARLGAFCKIMDNHFHHTTGDRHERPEAVPVVIGEGAVIGPRAVVLPGGGMGAGARLPPASVLGFRLRAGMDLARPRLGGSTS